MRTVRTGGAILIATVAAVNVFVIAMIGYGLAEAKDQREREVRTSIENVSRLVDQNITEITGKIDQSLREVVDELERDLRSRSTLDRAQVDAMLAERTEWLAGQADLRVVDASGVFRYGRGIGPGSTVSVADRPHFIAHRDDPGQGLLVSNPIYGPIAQTWLISFSRRYNGPDGRFAGIVAAAVPVDYFGRLISGIDLGPHGMVVLRDADAAVIVRHPADSLPAHQPGARSYSSELAAAMKAGGQPRTFIAQQPVDETPRMTSYRRLSAVPFHLVAGMAEQDYLAQWHGSVWKAVGIAALFLAATSVATWLAWRAFTRGETANQRSRILLRHASDGIHILDRTGRILEASDSFCRMLGYGRDELIGMNLSAFEAGFTPAELGGAFAENFEQREITVFQSRHRRKNGELFDVEVSVRPVQLGEQPVLFCSARDISERIESESKIRDLAFYDPLTRLPNRRLLMDRLHRSIAAGNRDGRQRALLFIDLDNFKTLNDTLGHEVGDQLLQEVARRLSASVRETDTVGRLGGDEFVVILERLSDKPEEAAAQTRAVVEKMVAALAHPCRLGEREHLTSASVGIALFGDPRQTVDEILKQADIAMYQAKAAGRNTMCFFAPELQTAVRARASLEDELRLGIAEGQFVLHYQPQVSLGGVIGAEALLRWEHPQRGLLRPAEFIPLAEESGLIMPLGSWVLRAGCRQLAAWNGRRGLGHLQLAVNIGAAQFRHPGFLDDVLGALQETGADPGRLKLELTEKLLAGNAEEAIAKMMALKSCGVRFALDDFGTGYSSLAQLKRLPLDELKIDESFVRDLPADANNAAIARTIVALGRTMGLAVIAEGVETARQRDFLAEIDCHSYQGNLFSRPLPAEQLMLLLVKAENELMA